MYNTVPESQPPRTKSREAVSLEGNRKRPSNADMKSQSEVAHGPQPVWLRGPPSSPCAGGCFGFPLLFVYLSHTAEPVLRTVPVLLKETSTHSKYIFIVKTSAPSCRPKITYGNVSHIFTRGHSLLSHGWLEMFFWKYLLAKIESFLEPW